MLKLSNNQKPKTTKLSSNLWKFVGDRALCVIWLQFFIQLLMTSQFIFRFIFNICFYINQATKKVLSSIRRVTLKRNSFFFSGKCKLNFIQFCFRDASNLLSIALYFKKWWLLQCIAKVGGNLIFSPRI